MLDFSQFLIAFGVACGIAAWYLFQNTLTKLIQHIQTSHKHVWSALGHPKVNDPSLRAISNIRLRRYILQKEYAKSPDFFVQNMGELLRQRLIFSLFCIACLIIGITLMLIAIATR